MGEGIELKVERIYRLEKDGALKGFADISVAGTFVIKGLRIVDGSQGLFVSMPQEKGKDGKWYDQAYPVSKDAREKLSDMVLAAFLE